MLRTAILEHPQDLKRIRPLWEKLATQSGSLFQGYAWNVSAFRIFAARERCRVIYLESENFVSIIPAVVTRGRNVRFAGEAMSDYREALFDGDPELLRSGWNILADWGLPLSVKAVRQDAIDAWQPLQPLPFATAPMVRHSELSAEEFLRQHNRLGRHSRRIAKRGINLCRHSGCDRALVRRIYEFKAQQPPESNLFRDPLRREFMMEVAGDPATHCEIFTYETSTELVAALVTFREERVRRFYTVFFDPRWAQLSPGQVLLFEITAESLAEGLDCDYLTGEYPYKMRLATSSIPLYQVEATPEMLRAAARERSSLKLVA